MNELNIDPKYKIDVVNVTSNVANINIMFNDIILDSKEVYFDSDRKIDINKELSGTKFIKPFMNKRSLHSYVLNQMVNNRKTKEIQDLEDKIMNHMIEAANNCEFFYDASFDCYKDDNYDIDDFKLVRSYILPKLIANGYDVKLLRPKEGGPSIICNEKRFYEWEEASLYDDYDWKVRIIISWAKCVKPNYF